MTDRSPGGLNRANGTGPPVPKSATPRLVTRAARKANNEERHIARTGRPGKADIHKLRADYRLLCKVQAPIAHAFWALEQRKVQLADRLANEGVKPFCRPRKPGFQP